MGTIGKTVKRPKSSYKIRLAQMHLGSTFIISYVCLFFVVILYVESPNKTEFIKAKYQMLAFVHRMPCRDDDSFTAKDLSKVRGEHIMCVCVYT